MTRQQIITAIRNFFIPPIFYESEGFVRIAKWLVDNENDARFGIRRSTYGESIAGDYIIWTTLTGKGWALEYCRLYGNHWKLTGSRAKMESDTMGMMLSI